MSNKVTLDFEIKGLDKLDKLEATWEKSGKGLKKVKKGYDEVADQLEVVTKVIDESTGEVKEQTQTLKEYQKQTSLSKKELIKLAQAAQEETKEKKKSTTATKKSSEAKQENKKETDKLTEATQKQSKATKASGISFMEFNAALELGKKGMTALSTVFGLATKAVNFFFDGFKRLDRLEELSTRTGTTVRLLSQLDLASRTAGVGMAGVAMATNQLSRFMYLATQGVKNQQRAFRDLGIDVKRSNGQIKSASEVLLEMADIMPTIENETVRTSLALSTMGRRGADMMSVLMGGADGLKRSIELNARLGLEVSRFSAEMADSIDNNMVIVSSVLDGVQTQIATGFAPAIRDLTNQFVYFLEDLNLADGGLRKIGASVGEFLRDQLTPLITKMREISQMSLFDESGMLTSGGKEAIVELLEAWLVSIKVFAGKAASIIASAIKDAALGVAPSIEDLYSQAQSTETLPPWMAEFVMSDEDLASLANQATVQQEKFRKKLNELSNITRDKFGEFDQFSMGFNVGSEEEVNEKIARFKKQMDHYAEIAEGSRQLQRKRDNENHAESAAHVNKEVELARQRVALRVKLNDDLKDQMSKEMAALDAEFLYANDIRKKEIEAKRVALEKEFRLRGAQGDLARRGLELEARRVALKQQAGAESDEQHKREVARVEKEIDLNKKQRDEFVENSKKKFRAESVLTAVQQEQVDKITERIKIETISNAAISKSIKGTETKVESDKSLAEALDFINAKILLQIDLDKTLDPLESNAIKQAIDKTRALREQSEALRVNNSFLSAMQKIEQDMARKKAQIKAFKEAKAAGLSYQDALKKVNAALYELDGIEQGFEGARLSKFVADKLAVDELNIALDRTKETLKEVGDVGQIISASLNEGIKGTLMSIFDGGNIGEIWKNAGKKLATNLFSQVIDEKLSFDAFFEGNILGLAAFAGKELFGGLSDTAVGPDFEGLSTERIPSGGAANAGGAASGTPTARTAATVAGVPIAVGGIMSMFYDGTGAEVGQTLLTGAGALTMAAVGLEAAGFSLGGAAVGLTGVATGLGGAGVGAMIGGMIGDAIGKDNYYKDNTAQMSGMVGGAIAGGVAAGVAAGVLAGTTIGTVTMTGIALGLAATGIGIIAAALVAVVAAIVGDQLAHVPTASTQMRDFLIDSVEADSEALDAFKERTGIDAPRRTLFAEGQGSGQETMEDFIARTGYVPAYGPRRTAPVPAGRKVNTQRQAGTDYSRRNMISELRAAGLNDAEIEAILQEGAAFGGVQGNILFRGPNKEGLRGQEGTSDFGMGRGEMRAFEAANQANLEYQRMYARTITTLMGEGYTLESARREADILAKEMLAEKGINLGAAILTSDDALYGAQQMFQGNLTQGGLGTSSTRRTYTIDPVTGERIELGAGGNIEQYRAASGQAADEMIAMARGWETLFADQIPKGLDGLDILMAGLGEQSFISEEQAKERLQAAIESGETMNAEAAAKFVEDWQKSSEEAAKAIDKIFEVGDAQEGINQFIAGFSVELSQSIRAAVRENLLGERGGISGALVPVSSLVSDTDFTDSASIQNLRDKLPDAISQSKENLQEFIPVLKEQLELEKELNNEIAIALGLLTREELVLQEAIAEHGEKKVERFLKLVELQQLINFYGEERALQIQKENEDARELAATYEGMAEKVRQISESIGQGFAQSLGSAVGNALRDGILAGVFEGMDGASDYIKSDADISDALNKSIGLAMFNAILNGAIQGIMTTAGLDAMFEAAGKAMEEYVQSGAAIVRQEREKEEDQVQHARTMDRIAEVEHISEAKHQADVSEANRNHEIHMASLEAYKDEVNALLFTGKITASQYSEAMGLLNARSTEEEYAHFDRVGRINEQRNAEQSYIDGARQNEEERHIKRQRDLENFITTATNNREAALGRFNEVVGAIPQMTQDVMDLIGSPEFQNMMRDIFDQFGLSFEDIFGPVTQATDEVTQAAEDAINKTLDLRDYVSYVGGSALGQTGRMGGVIESGQFYVEPSENFSLSNDSKNQANFDTGYSINNEVHIEIDGDTMVKGNIQSKGLATLANVPGA
jgi:hypothetical protein